jgi:hypothetical protein
MGHGAWSMGKERGGEREIEGWRDREIERWRDGEMERWRDGGNKKILTNSRDGGS